MASPTAGAPFGAVGRSPARCRCGRGRHATKAGLCAGGHPWVGFPGPALLCGEHAAPSFWSVEAEARRGIVEDVVRDAGFTAEDAPRALELAAEALAQAVLLKNAAYARVVESGGPLTSAQRPRRAYAVWLAATARVTDYVRLIGLRRVPRPAQTLQEYVASLADERDQIREHD